MEAECALIVGLGNPGRRYARTRHNVGFDLVDRLAERFSGTEWERYQKSDLCRREIDGVSVLLLKPGMYMNRSGEPTVQAVQRYAVPLERVLVVYDDLDLACGRLRLRGRGSSGGHRGVADVIEEIGAGFSRLRLGIDHPAGRQPVEDYVLERFDPEQQEKIDRVLERAEAAARLWVREGIAAAMNEFNREPVEKTAREDGAREDGARGDRPEEIDGRPREDGERS